MSNHTKSILTSAVIAAALAIASATGVSAHHSAVAFDPNRLVDVKFRDRVLRSDIREANCLSEDNDALPGLD